MSTRSMAIQGIIVDTKIQPVSPLINQITHVRDVCITQLRHYFSQQAVPYLTWREDEAETDIFIADEYPESSGASSLKPAIIVERGDVLRSMDGLNDSRTAGTLGGEIFKRSWGLTIPTLLHCISEDRLHAEDIQWTVHAVISIYLDRIAAISGSIYDLGEIELKKPQSYQPEKVGQSGKGDWADAPVACQWQAKSTFYEHEARSESLHDEVEAGFASGIAPPTPPRPC